MLSFGLFLVFHNEFESFRILLRMPDEYLHRLLVLLIAVNKFFLRFRPELTEPASHSYENTKE